MIPKTHIEAVFEIWRTTGERAVCSLEGNCMSPFLREGDSLVVQYGNHDIRTGDVVLFRSPESILVHRVVHVEREGRAHRYVLKADQLASFHPPVSADRILGKVVEARGPGGTRRFESSLWRRLNYLLALRSYVSGRRSQADSPLWKAVNAMFALRAKVLPEGLSISLLPFKAIDRLTSRRRSARRVRPKRLAEG